MSDSRKIIAWIPIVGLVSEFMRKDLYLMDSNDQVRYFASACYHGAFFYFLIWSHLV